MRRFFSFLIVFLTLLTVVACKQESLLTPESELVNPAPPTAGPEETVLELAQPTEVGPAEKPTPTEVGDEDLAAEDPAVIATRSPELAEESGVKPDDELVEVGPTVGQMMAGLDGLNIDAFFDRSFELILLRRPQWITELGLEEYFGMRNDRLDNLSDAYIQETYDLQEAILDRLQQYDQDSLTPEQQISYDIYDWWLELEVGGRDFMYHDYPVHHFINGYPDNLLLFFTDTHPLNNREDAEDYISRLSQVDEQIAQVIEGLEIRTKSGIIPPDFILRLTRERMIADLGQSSLDPDLLDPANVSLYTAFQAKLNDIEGLAETDKKTLRSAAANEIEQSFFPAYVELISYLDSLAGQATADAGVWRLPDGQAYYAYLLAESTSTDMTPAEIHELGLREVERIHAELNELFARLGYDTREDLKTLMYQAIDDGGTISGSSQVLESYNELIAGVEERLGDMFDISPKAELVVVGDRGGGGGYYLPASMDGNRPGAFHAGVNGPIPRYFMATVTYHEGVPGHHFQIGLAQEMEGLPLFRKVLQYNGYIEGWALYAERLAKEMGLYEDNPYGDVGRLELELLRAIRLVTDTGIHDLGWTRQEARDYMIEAMGGAGWTHEVERYVVLPGQATGYMVGMLTILEQRQKAQEALGESFDIVDFHRVVLENGSLPLDILVEVVDRWIATVKEPA